MGYLLVLELMVKAIVGAATVVTVKELRVEVEAIGQLLQAF